MSCRHRERELRDANGANRAPGTTHACKNLFPEEVYVSVGFKADLAIFVDTFKCELSDLLREE